MSRRIFQQLLERASERMKGDDERRNERKQQEERKREKAAKREASASLKFPRYRRTSKQLIKARVPTDR